MTTILAQTCEIVGSVTDGDAALVAIDALKPDVVVLDISLPGISGFDVASRLRDSGSTVPLVFLSSYDDEDLKRAAEASGNAYVVKSKLADVAGVVLVSIARPPAAG